MNQPLVSVVVISYNHEIYIKEMLDSLRNQTYSNWELIVADDASKDSSVEVFKTWLHENGFNAKEIYHEVNTGLATVLNQALNLCQGKYVKLIAADDFLHPSYLEECIQTMQKEKTKIVFTQAFSVDNKSNVLSENFFSIPENPTKDIKTKLACGNYISGATLCYDMDVIKIIGNYKIDLLLEDYDFILRAVNNNCEISFINKNLVFYRQHDSNISKTKLLALEVETELLKYTYFNDREFANVINKSTSLKIKRYGRDFVKLIFMKYLNYQFKSKKVILKMIINYF